MGSNRILVWVIVLLALLNVTTIIVIIYHNWQEKKLEEDAVIVNEKGTVINGRYLRQNLNFDNQQIEKFREANRIFRPGALRIIHVIDSLKREMLIELNKPFADTAKLNGLSFGIGDAHGRLKQEAFRFYLRIKAVCRPDQMSNFEVAFRPLFEQEVLPGGPQGGGFGRGRGMGRHGRTDMP